MLRIGLTEYEAMRAHGEETYPHECCGILLGTSDSASESNEARRVLRAGNTRTDAAHNRYHIAPEELIRAQRDGRREGLDIVGFYHSHPDHPARWSATDFAEAHWFGCSYVITAVEQGRAAATNAFLLTGTDEESKSFADEAIEISLPGDDGEVAGILEMEGRDA